MQRCASTWCAAERCGGMMWQPNELGFARAYVSGDLVIDGDLWDALTALDDVADPATGPGVHIDAHTLRSLARVVLRLGLVGPPPRPPEEESRLRGRKHCRASRCRRHRPPLRRGQRLLPGAARPEHDLLVRVLAARHALPRSGAGGQVRAGGAQAGPAARHARARRRLWVGHVRDPRGPAARCERRRRHLVRTAGAPRASASGRGRPCRSGRDPRPGLPPCRRRALRCDRQHRHGRARRLRRVAGLRQQLVRAAASGRAVAQPRDLAASRTASQTVAYLVHRPLRVPRRRTRAGGIDDRASSRTPDSRYATCSHCASTTRSRCGRG